MAIKCMVCGEGKLKIVSCTSHVTDRSGKIHVIPQIYQSCDVCGGEYYDKQTFNYNNYILKLAIAEDEDDNK